MPNHHQDLIVSYSIFVASLIFSPLLAINGKKGIAFVAIVFSAYILYILPNTYDIAWYRNIDLQKFSDLVEIIEQQDYEFFVFTIIYLSGSLTGAFLIAYSLPLLSTRNPKIITSVCLLLLAPGFFLLQFNTIRQGISSLYGMMSLVYYFSAAGAYADKQYQRLLSLSALWLCLAIFTHRSSLILLIFPALVFLKTTSKLAIVNHILKRTTFKLCGSIILASSALLIFYRSELSDILQVFQYKLALSTDSYSKHIDKSPLQLLLKLVWPGFLLYETYRSLSWKPTKQLIDFTLFLFLPIVVFSTLAQLVLVGSGDRVALWLTPCCIACYVNFSSNNKSLTFLMFLLSGSLSYIAFLFLPSITELLTH